jgi:hypothetical protein
MRYRDIIRKDEASKACHWPFGSAILLSPVPFTLSEKSRDPTSGSGE